MDRVFVLCALVAAVGRAAPSGDEVRALPGWESPLPSRVFSGFVDVSATMGRKMKVSSREIAVQQAAGRW